MSLTRLRPTAAAFVTACATLALSSGTAGAAIGDLVQKSGTNACISLTGNSGACLQATGLQGTEGVLISPDGRNAYVASAGSNAITIFDRNPFTGVLTQKAGVKGCISKTGSGGACATGIETFEGINSLAISPNGKNLYAVAANPNGALLILDRNTSNGELKLKTGTAGCFTNAGIDSVCNAGRGLRRSGCCFSSQSLTISPDGKSVYVASYGDSALAIFRRDLATGTLSQPASTKACFSPDGSSNYVAGRCEVGRGLAGLDSVSVSPDGKNVYASAWEGNSVVAFSRNTTSGELTQLSGTNGCISDSGDSGSCTIGRGVTAGNAIQVSPDGKNVYVAGGNGSVTSFDRNSTTGAITQKAGGAGCIASVQAGSLSACALYSSADSTPLGGQDGYGGYALTLSRDGRSLYYVTLNGHAVVTFDRNRATGALSTRTGAGQKGCVSSTAHNGLCTVGAAFDSPQGVTVSPEGRHVYVTSTNADAVLLFDRTRPSSAYTVKSLSKAVKKNAVVVTATLSVPGDGTVTVTVKDGAKAVCVKSAVAAAAGQVKVVCSIGTATRKKLRRAKLNVTVVTAFAPTGQEAASKTQKLALPKSR